MRSSLRWKTARLCLPLALLGVTGCSSEHAGIVLFESGTLDHFEIDGERVDADVEYAVLCLWATSENGPLSIVPSDPGAEGAPVDDLIISFEAPNELTSVSVRVGEDRVTWNADDPVEGPTFEVTGRNFALAGTLSDGARSFEVSVAGSCETAFD